MFIKQWDELRCIDAVVVGGAVRDYLLGEEPADFDFATPYEPNIAVKRLKQAGVEAGVQSERFKTVWAKLGGFTVEITTYRRDVGGRQGTTETVVDLEQDLARRDFTVNATAMTLDGELIDPYGGKQDLRDKVLRFVGDPVARLREDPLRAIRGVRLAGKLNLTIEPDTRRALGTHMLSCLEAVSVERLVSELDKIFGYPAEKVVRTLDLFWDYGIIRFMFPEFTGAESLIQNPEYHPEGDVWAHTTKTTSIAPPTYRWQAFLHDVGKPACAEWKGKFYTFYDHPKVGARLIREQIGPRLKLSNALTESCAVAAEAHLKAHQITTEKGRRRFWANYSKYIPVIHAVTIADCADRKDHHEWIYVEPEEPVEPILKGRHLIKAGVEPGPKMGKMLEHALNLQIDEGISDIDVLLEAALNPEGD